MSNNFVLVNQTPTLLQFRISGDPVLHYIPSVSFSAGDSSLEFCPFADFLFDEYPEIRYVRLDKKENTDFISISSMGKGNLSLTAETALDVLHYAAGQAALFDEAGLLAASKNAPPMESAQLKELGALTRVFIQEQALPQVRKRTGHHDANVSFVGFYPDRHSNDRLMLGVHLENSCRDCAASVFTTLSFIGNAVQDIVISPQSHLADGKKLAGYIVLPNENGSPSFTHYLPAQKRAPTPS